MAKKKDVEPSEGGRPNKEIDLSKVEELAGKGLSVSEICICLGISETLFYAKQRENPEFYNAAKKGRANLVATMADVVIEMATNWMTEDSVRLRAAQTVLKRHGEDWREKVDVQHSGSLSVNTVFDNDSLLRIATTYVQLSGDEDDGE